MRAILVRGPGTLLNIDLLEGTQDEFAEASTSPESVGASSFYVSGSLGITTLEPLAHLTALKEFDIHDCSTLEDITALGRLTALERINIVNTSGFIDFTQLRGATSLREIYI